MKHPLEATGGFGGLGLGRGNINPENMLLTLDEAVRLTPEQKTKARQILEKEAADLNALAPVDRMAKGMPIRQAARDDLRELLTPEQRRIQDDLRRASQAQETEERDFVTGILRSSQNVAARVGPVTGLSLQTSSASVDDSSRRGRFTYLVVGRTGSETVRVSWERIPAGGPMKVLKIESSDGTVIQP